MSIWYSISFLIQFLYTFLSSGHKLLLMTHVYTSLRKLNILIHLITVNLTRHSRQIVLIGNTTVYSKILLIWNSWNEVFIPEVLSDNKKRRCDKYTNTLKPSWRTSSLRSSLFLCAWLINISNTLFTTFQLRTLRRLGLVCKHLFIYFITHIYSPLEWCRMPIL